MTLRIVGHKYLNSCHNDKRLRNHAYQLTSGVQVNANRLYEWYVRKRELQHSCYVSEQWAFLGPCTLVSEFIEKFLCMLEVGLFHLVEALRATCQCMENR